MKTMKESIQKKVIRLFSSSILMTIFLILNSSFMPPPVLTDPEIAKVAVTANQIDINYAKLAKDKSKNTEVLKFANTMITDHQSVINQAVALVTKLKVTPKDNELSMKLNSDANTMKKTLMEKTGKAFNKSYINNEVSYHKAVINTVESVLIPQTKNAELKALLTKVVPILKSHLEHAEMLQKTLSK